MMKPLLTWCPQQASEVPFEVAVMSASVALQHNRFHDVVVAHVERRAQRWALNCNAAKASAPTEVRNAPSVSVR
jgi:hypothetical protein